MNYEYQGKPQSYYIIQAAQRREELQRKGDELDQTVKKPNGFDDKLRNEIK